MDGPHEWLRRDSIYLEPIHSTVQLPQLKWRAVLLFVNVFTSRKWENNITISNHLVVTLVACI